MLSDLGFRTTFLDDLATFERLKIEGIPERHQRLLMHQVLFTAARLWGWFGDEPRLRQEWLQIISINPQRIGCSVSEALADMLRHRQQSPDFKFHLPNTKILPPINKREIKLLQKRLQDRGCTDPVSASRIIAQVLYPAIQKCPQACQRGTTAIQSRDLQQVSLEKNYKPAVGWLAVNNILVMTESKYQPGVRSRLYRINVPLILWLLRFRTQDLIWQWTQGESAKASGAAETAAGVEEPEEDWLTEAAVAIARPSA